jgi:hypothetical protein
MDSEKVKCSWCDEDYNLEEMAESRFLGGPVCPQCDADEGRKTLGDIKARMENRARQHLEDGVGWCK